jgi:hypothetical protein
MAVEIAAILVLLFAGFVEKKSKKEHHEVTKNTKVHEEERCEMGKAADKGGPFLSKKKGFSSWLFLRALRVFVVIF